MNITILGDGSFGSFLKRELPTVGFNVVPNCDNVILAVPLSAYEECARKYRGAHLINVCSVQEPSTNILLRHTDKVTSLHPLFGARTPADKRNTIVTHLGNRDDVWYDNAEQAEFIRLFRSFSNLMFRDWKGNQFSPESHDKLMAKTHLVALNMAKVANVFLTNSKDIPDEYLPNSFRLLKQFAQTLEDMPAGTVSSIMANEQS